MPSTLARSPKVPPIGTTPQRGLTAVEFVCPRCGGRRWGTTAGRGHCNDCPLSWARVADWLYFSKIENGSRFVNRAAYDAFTARPPHYEPPTVEHICNVNDLLRGRS